MFTEERGKEEDWVGDVLDCDAGLSFDKSNGEPSSKITQQTLFYISQEWAGHSQPLIGN